MHNPFRSALDYLKPTPLPRWGAYLSSLVAAICLVLLFPILYLFVDLLVGQGRVPSYGSLPAHRQEQVRAEWERLNETGQLYDIHKAIRPTVAWDVGTLEWEWRWQSIVYHDLETRVSPEAAEAYLPLRDLPSGQLALPNPQGIGFLATVVRERTRPIGSVLALLAKFTPWTWEHSPGRSPNLPFLTTLLIVAALLTIIRGVALNLASYWASVATIDAGIRLRRAVYTHGFRLSSLAVQAEAQNEAGELVTHRVDRIQDGMLAHLTSATRGPVVIGLLLVLLFAVHFWLTLSLLLLAMIVWLVAGQTAAYFRRDARLASRRADARLEMMRESMSIAQLVKAYLMERFNQSRFERQLSDLGRSIWRRNRGETFSRPTLLAVVSFAGVGMLYLAGWVVLSGEMSVAGLIVKGAAIVVLMTAITRYISARVRVTRAREAAAEVFEFLDRRGDVGQNIDAEFLSPMTRKLELVEVSYRQPGTGRMILENVSLSIPAGSRASIVFANPEEARTVANMITRFLDPTAGEIRIDGKNIRWVTYESVRTQAALVMEQSLTFSDTIANNIGCGDPGFSLPQIIEAAKVAHAHQFIQRLPYGYETVIGDGGLMLRPGERFRISLARAILRDPSLIIIEEPSTPLDADSLVLIDDTVSRIQTNRTLLFLARRPSTVKASDQIFILQNGQIVASGRHDELVQGNELYRLLHFKQSLTSAVV